MSARTDQPFRWQKGSGISQRTSTAITDEHHYQLGTSHEIQQANELMIRSYQGKSPLQRVREELHRSHARPTLLWLITDPGGRKINAKRIETDGL